MLLLVGGALAVAAAAVADAAAAALLPAHFSFVDPRAEGMSPVSEWLGIGLLGGRLARG